MKHFIEYPLEDGGSVIVEIDNDNQLSGSVQASRGTESIVTKAKQTFDNALERIKPAANVIIKKLRGLTDAPDEIEVEFGIKLGAEAGAVIATTSMEANYKVVLKWIKPRTQAKKPRKR
ncbi:MAG: CU044_2847 family protein [bacterium]|nr:CU044_2847 family protein [bacterium]